MPASSKTLITLIVNGTEYGVHIEPKTTLLHVLRDQLGLTGTKNGCGQGRCGACTVIVNGEAVRSCTFLAWRADGARVETVEGLAQGGKLHPLQQAFINYGAVQCGFCTPGMLMAAKALLDRVPQPSRQDIYEALRTNLCRCTGYVKIIEAIEGAAQGQLNPAPEGERPRHPIGARVPRPDAMSKVTGAARYAADITFENMVYVKVLRSEHAHAKVTRLDVTRARAAPGVLAVCTAQDVPGAKRHGVVSQDWPVFVEDEVCYVGDALAMAVAETESQAEAALKLIEVDYEPLPVVDSAEAGVSPHAPLAHLDSPNGNVLMHIHFERGDVDKAFSEAAVVIEREYRTPFSEHAFLEPEAAVARWDEQGTLVVYCGSQIPFADRRQIAASLALPEEKVRVIQTPVGGAFGGKEDISAQIHAALATYVTGRPAKLVFTRRESMRVHPKRHATVIRLKTAADREGRLLAVDAKLLGDTGAYASLGVPVMTRAATHVTGPYHVPNVRVDCTAVYTNNPPAGAFRGFGVTQAHFASEIQMDILAHELGLSPFEIRRRNGLRVGSSTCTGQVLREGVGLLETLDAVEEAVRRIQAQEQGITLPAGVRRGWGIASACKNVGLGNGIPDSAGAEVELDENGTVHVRAGAAEVGQGLITVLAQIAAQELGLWPDQVDVLLADTALTLEGGPTTASRQSFITGNAVRLACAKLREQLVSAMAEKWEISPEQIALQDGHVVGPAGQRVPLAEAGALARAEGRKLSVPYVYTPPATVPLGQPGDSHFGYGYATHAIQVEVAPNGSVRVLRVIAAHDVGKAINRMALEGQIHGGIMMGIGYALTEEFVVENGRVVTDSFATYHIPHVEQTPEITPIVVEVPLSTGPYGAKGAGEITSIPVAPAIINAIYDATGVRYYTIPVKAERLAEDMKTACSGGNRMISNP